MFSSLLSLVSLISLALALSLDPNSQQSVNSDTKLIAKGLLDYYAGSHYGGTVGMFVQPYYWWHAGAAWNSMVEYWAITGDDTYLDTTKQALISQRGDKYDLMVANYSTSEGNDDQGVWALTMMAAAERGFPDAGDGHSWLDVAKNAFATMVARWDSNCGGGVRWQIFSSNNGWNYKNSVSNGAIFSLAARLYYNTGEKLYLEWAETAWNWLWNSGLIEHDSYRVNDGLDADDCSQITHYLWTYNAGMMQSGTAYLYAATGNKDWDTHTRNFWNSGKSIFFENKIMLEIACQQGHITCNNDQRTFKGIYANLLGLTAEVHSGLADEIIDYLTTSAKAAANTCSGGSDGHTCSLDWISQKYDGNWIGLGEQISALSVILNSQALKVHAAPRAKTNQDSVPSNQQGLAPAQSFLPSSSPPSSSAAPASSSAAPSPPSSPSDNRVSTAVIVSPSAHPTTFSTVAVAPPATSEPAQYTGDGTEVAAGLGLLALLGLGAILIPHLTSNSTSA
ncbi:Mannan endo-1,6-alpha-mannosidase DCW1 [Yarrowia sp. B02]|nr:Mannan endo-1,6-alpha-mannosidase DCW1 [Yarrowia sp. B02]